MIQDFLRPETIDEALALRKSKNDGCWYAGGSYINNADNGDVCGTAISLERLNIADISLAGDFLKIGAAVTLQVLIDTGIVPQILKDAAKQISIRNIRNAATIGGNIGSRSPESSMIPILIALDAQLDCAESGSVSLETYISDSLKDLILSVRIPSNPVASAINKISRTSSSPALVHAAVVLSPGSEPGSVKKARVVLNGISGCVTRIQEAEDAIVDGSLRDQEAIQSAVAGVLQPDDDYRCSKEYKIYIASVIAADCILECLGGLK